MSRHPSPDPARPSVLSSRLKSKPHTIGIAAGAEDVKYQAKYKDLKRKVKEIEADNDKLHFKVLQAKRSIQRMKLERAILYERLSDVPPSPELHGRQPLPPIHAGPGIPPPPHGGAPGPIPPREPREHPSAMEPNHPLMDHFRTHESARAYDGRPDMHMGPGVAPPPHAFPLHAPRDASRQLPPLPPLPPAQHMDPARTQHPSPRMHHAHSDPPHRRPQTYAPTPPHAPQYTDPLPHVLSPPLGARRHDLHELAGGRGPRMHNHQRLGPGTYVNRGSEHGYEREVEMERGWERGREGHSHEHHQGYYHEGAGPSGYAMVSRSGTPGSGSGSGSGPGAGEVPSRPDSRGQYYEQARGYRLRPVNQSHEEYGQQEGRSQGRDRGGGGGTYVTEQNGGSVESRKRTRGDMEVDGEHDVQDAPMRGHLPDDRGSKRFHQVDT